MKKLISRAKNMFSGKKKRTSKIEAGVAVASIVSGIVTLTKYARAKNKR